MKKIFARFILCGISFVSLFSPVKAGNLESPADPSDPASALFSQEDLYLRLTTGAAGSKRTGGFTEPTTGPDNTGHTMDEIMNAAPSADSINGATPEDVATGKTFWGLSEGNWGLQSGTGSISSENPYPAPVPVTGQTTCFEKTITADGTFYLAIDCAGTGQDGELQSGVSLPEPRFAINGDGTVTDNLTGLIWLQNANCSLVKRTWDQALAEAATLQHGSCGLTDGSIAGDWRMPNLFELESLRNMNYSEPVLSNTAGTGHWVENDPFYNVVNAQYWSSTTVPNTTGSAACVVFSNGNENSTGKSSTSFAWAVRGGK